MHAYKKEVNILGFAIVIYVILNFSTAYVTSIFVDKIQNSGGQISEEDKYIIPGLFLVILIALFFSVAIYNYMIFEVSRISYLARNSLNFLIFQKILDFDVLNGTYSEGKIVNMIQVDCTKFETLILNLANLLAMLLILIGGSIYMGLILGGGVVLTFVFSFIISSFLLTTIYSWRIKISRALIEAKDKRVALLKNVVSNISYIKMRAWENFYSARIFRLRDEEVKKLLENAFLMGVLVFINWFNRGLSLSVVLLYKSFINTANFGYNEISAFLRIFDLIRIVLMNLPFSIAYFVDLSVSTKRIGDFLIAKNLDKSWIKDYTMENLEGETHESEELDDNLAINLENGYFNWMSRLTE